ncbi:hypothetical protein ALO_08450 [Acetonema longum DSM 6540]|uniref:Uncharacterized protein n=2 Tax=Acetonema TaxID=2373 RepID=F7NHZ2_9FIRM|nr:hypothetical protein ALO_08450 [Acetonema longum DSM 6540]
MNMFGNMKKFAIEYQFLPSPYEEEEVLQNSWGIFRLWVAGYDICEYTINDDKKPYEWNLIHIVEWLCNNLEFILGYDPFPLPVQGDNILELIQESDKFESEEDDELYLWYQAKNSWLFRHSWFSSRAGSMLASVYFRRNRNYIEVAWNNNFFEDKQIFFTNPKGSYAVPKADFKKTIFDFLDNILSNLETKLGRDAKIGDQSITGLQKKVSMLK